MKNVKQQFPTVPCRFEFSKPFEGWARAEFFVNEQSYCSEDIKDPVSLNKFQSEFIRKMQTEYILEHVANTGQVIASTNCISEFWTKEFILQVADSLRRPRKRLPVVNTAVLKLYLLATWHDKRYKLSEMTRKELAAHINDLFKPNPKITPAAAWQIAYRLDLFSKRTSGPKGEQPASKL
jgi:hypothetical protein